MHQQHAAHEIAGCDRLSDRTARGAPAEQRLLPSGSKLPGMVSCVTGPQRSPFGRTQSRLSCGRAVDEHGPRRKARRSRDGSPPQRKSLWGPSSAEAAKVTLANPLSAIVA